MINAATKRSRSGSYSGSSSAKGLQSSQPWRLRSFAPSRTTCLLLYVLVVFAFSTVFLGTNMRWTQLMFIDNRNYPGGPIAWADDFATLPLSQAINIIFILITWLTDGILIWRCAMLWTGKWSKFVMILPVLMYFATIGLGIVLMTVFSGPFASNILLAMYSVSLSLNVVITALILLRLFMHARSVSRVLGRSFAKKYEEIATIIVESALLTASVSVGMIITVALRNNFTQVFLTCMPYFQVISTFLIIVRVLDGTAVNTTQSFSSMTRSTGYVPSTPGGTRTIEVIQDVPASAKSMPASPYPSPYPQAANGKVPPVPATPLQHVVSFATTGSYKSSSSFSDDKEAMGGMTFSKAYSAEGP